MALGGSPPHYGNKDTPSFGANNDQSFSQGGSDLKKVPIGEYLLHRTGPLVADIHSMQRLTLHSSVFSCRSSGSHCIKSVIGCGRYDVDLSFATASPAFMGGGVQTDDNPLAYRYSTQSINAGQLPPVQARPPLPAPRPSQSPWQSPLSSTERPRETERQTAETGRASSPAASSSTGLDGGDDGLSPTRPPPAPPRLSLSQPGRTAWPEMSPAPPKLQSQLSPVDRVSPGSTSMNTPSGQFRPTTMAVSAGTTPRPQGRPDPWADLRQSAGPRHTGRAAAIAGRGPTDASGTY